MPQPDPQLRVLFADWRERFWNRLSRNYRYRYERILACGPPFHMVDTSPGMLPETAPESTDLLLVGVFAALQDPSVEAPCGVPPSWFEHIAKRCVMVEDTREPERLANTTNGNGSQYLLATYDCAELHRLRRQCRHLRKTYILPHHIDMDVFRDFQLEKTYDVLIYGHMWEGNYPFRSRLRSLLAASSLKVKIVDHPGRDNFDRERTGPALARLINQSWLAIATPTISDYLVAKYLEIAACGCVVAGKMATEGLPLFGDNYIRLAEDMTDAEILDRLSAALREKDALRRRASAMYGRVRNGFTLDAYAGRMLRIVRDIAADSLDHEPPAAVDTLVMSEILAGRAVG